MGAIGAVLATTDGESRYPLLRATGSLQPILADYVGHYGQIDPIMGGMEHRPAGLPLTDEMILPRSELTRTEFYNDFARRYDLDNCICAFAYREPTRSGFLIASRSARHEAFGCAQVELLALLLPHLNRAMRIDLKLRAVGATGDATADVLDRLSQGIMLVDVNSRVLLANRAAEAMFRAADGVGVNQNGLCAASPAQTGRLRRAIAKAAGTPSDLAAVGSLQLERPSARRAFAAAVLPLPAPTAWAPIATAKAVVFITDPELTPALPSQRLRDLYGLTTAEAQTALSLVDAEGLRDVADRRGVSINTVRTHLQRSRQDRDWAADRGGAPPDDAGLGQRLNSMPRTPHPIA